MRFRHHHLVVSVLATTALLGACTQKPQPDMWRCTATNSQQAHWIQYSPTQIEAATLVRDRCRTSGYRPSCIVRCTPPKVRWHCVATDKGGHAWYWNSTNRNVAIHNALRVCMHNTTLGECRVPVGNCSMT